MIAERTTKEENERRSQWADAAIRTFMQVTRCDEPEALGDLLCDLMHWTAHHDHDFNVAIRTAYDHYHKEKREAEEEALTLDEISPIP